MASPRLRLIVNADDFGQSDDTVDATIECFAAGALTSATLMPSMPAAERAAEFARGRPEFGYGVHLTFVRDPVERPLSDPGLVPCLVDADGRLLPTREVRRRALTGRLVVEQLVREVEAQVEAVRGLGVPVSHVDSHRHVHKLAPFRRALALALPRLGLGRVRNAQDTYTTRPLTSPTYWLGRYWRRRIVREFRTTEHFFMPRMDEPPWSSPLLRVLDALEPGTIEVGVHPGRAEAWRDRDRVSVLELGEAVRDRAALVDWRSLGHEP